MFIKNTTKTSFFQNNLIYVCSNFYNISGNENQTIGYCYLEPVHIYKQHLNTLGKKYYQSLCDRCYIDQRKHSCFSTLGSSLNTREIYLLDFLSESLGVAK